MNIVDVQNYLPKDVGITAFQDVVLNDGREAVRVTLDRVLKEGEKKKLKRRDIVGVDCIAQYRYAPEIKTSYFYLVEGEGNAN